jgi:membrane protein
MAVVHDAQAAVARAQQSRLGRFLARWGEVQADDQAALIAFTLLFSLFPLIGGLLTLIGLIFRDPAALQQVADTVAQRFPSQLDDLLGFLRETRDISGVLGLLSLVGLLWSGSAVFGTMAKAFNTIYGLPERGLVGQKLMSFVMIFILLGLIIITVVASSAVTALVGLSTAGLPVALPAIGLAQSAIGWGVSIGSAVLMFMVLDLVVPHARLTPGQVWPGALASALLFVVLSQLFPIYIRFFGGGFAAYKTLGLFLLLMTWLYFTARIIVFGCLLNAFVRPLGAENAAGRPLRSSPVQPAPSRFRRFTGALAQTIMVFGLLVVAARIGRRGES